MKKKLTMLAGATLVLVLAVAGGFSTPRAALAICLCESYNANATSIKTGTGTSCAAARSSLTSQVNAEANASCGGPTKSCLGTIVITTACHSIGGGNFSESGYREFDCKVCGPINP